MKTHGPFVTKIGIWLTVFSPLIGMIIAVLSAWLFGQLNG
jgi:hypothetical protein